MKSIGLYFMGLFLTCAAVTGTAFWQSANKNVYLMEDDEHHQWCGYRTEAAWRSEVDAVSSSVFAIVDYANDHVASIRLTTGDTPGAGDWVVFDTYSLDANGKLRGLKRVMNVLPGDRSEHEEWLIQNGKATKQRSTTLSLETQKPAQRPDAELPRVPIITNVERFPFWPLTRDKGQEIVAKGKVCIPYKG